MSYPLPSQVQAGVVFGSANELVGTLQPIFATATVVRTSQMRTTVISRPKKRASEAVKKLPPQQNKSRIKKSVSIRTQASRVTVLTQTTEVSIRTTFELVA